MVFPCTRRGCAAAEDHWPHVEARITPDGLPIHGYALEDNRPKDETGVLHICKTGERDPDFWRVFIEAVGDEPWTIGVEMFAKTFPLRECDRLVAKFVVPDAPGLLAALGRVQAKVDKPNVRR
jgi:hypothetical protein